MSKTTNNMPPAISVALTEADERQLQNVDAKYQMVRDHVAAVAMALSTGMYLHGPGGCGKSFVIEDELRRRQVPYKLYNSRMTGRALFNALETHPDAIHLLEDMEQLFRDTGARGVLRSALWSQQTRDGHPNERLVTWSTHRMEHSVVFTGGLIMTANRPFPEIPELDAIKTRIAYTQLTMSDQEMIAMMRRLCLDGQSTKLGYVSPAECREVCDYIVEQCGGLNRRFDLRLYKNAIADYAQWRDIEAGCHWHDLVSARIKERPTKIGPTQDRTQRRDTKQQEFDLAQELAAVEDRQERFARWFDATGKSEPTMYRRLEQAKAAHSHLIENENGSDGDPGRGHKFDV